MASLVLRTVLKVSRNSSQCLSGCSSRSFHAATRRQEQYPRADLKTFNKVINTKDRLILVDFYADWCGPCHQLSPVLESLITNPDVKSGSGLPIDLVKINTDDGDGLLLGQKFKVRGLPTVIAFKNGEPVDQFVGALNEPGVRRFLSTV